MNFKHIFGRKRIFIGFTLLPLLAYFYNADFILTYMKMYMQNHVHLKLNGENMTHLNPREEFEAQWCRMMNIRTDWKSIMKSCDGKTSWKSRNTERVKSLQTDAKLSSISYMDIGPAGEFSRLFIRTLTKKGALKTIGGDSWRVRINGTASVNSKVFDNDNGTYEVLFLCEDEGSYNVHIYLDYSMCNGLMDPPDNWFIKGSAQGKNQGVDVIGTPKDFLMMPLNNTPITIKIKRRRIKKTNKAPICKGACNFLWNGQGRWNGLRWKQYFKDEAWQRIRKERSKTETKGNLLIYGDSVSVFFAQSLQQRPVLCRKIFNSCKFRYNWIYNIDNVTAAKKERDNLDFNVTRVVSEFKSTVLSEEYNNENSVVIFNFGLHFVESTNFSNYQTLIKSIAEFVSPKEGDKYGGQRFIGNAIWKSSTAIQKERADLPQLHWRRFFTNYRIQLYNAYAADVMCNHGIQVIDDYPISESYPLGTGTHSGRKVAKNDIVHYNNEAFYPVEEFLEEWLNV